MAGITAIVAQDQFDPGSGKIESIAGSNMAPFLTKLFQIVSANTTDHCIQWTPKGDSFVISDPDTFARDILPTYFKHNNIRSFIRQLNTYGFRKRTNISSTDEHLEFFHEKFRRDQLSLLMQIKRCHQPKPQSRQSGPSVEEAVVDAKNAPDMDTIRSRVGELKARLGALQGEIRDYNMQMEHKVNVLMQILQTSMPAEPAPQRPARAVGALGQEGQVHELQQSLQPPSLPQPQQPALPQMQQQLQPPQQSAQTSSFASQLGMPPMGGLPLRQSGSVPPAAGAFNPSVDLLHRCDALFASLGEQSSLSTGLNSSLTGMGGIAGLGLPGLGNAINGIGGVNGGLASGLMGGLGGLGGLTGGGAPKPGEVAGLQHLLEAAQRYREGGAEGEAGGRRPAQEEPARTTQVASS